MCLPSYPPKGSHALRPGTPQIRIITPNLPVGAGLVPALVPPKGSHAVKPGPPPNRVITPNLPVGAGLVPALVPPKKVPMLSDLAPPPKRIITPNLPVGAGLVPALVPPKRVPCCQTRHPPKSHHHPQFTRRGRPCACPRTTQKGPNAVRPAPPKRIITPNLPVGAGLVPALVPPKRFQYVRPGTPKRVITPNQPALTRLVPALAPPPKRQKSPARLRKPFLVPQPPSQDHPMSFTQSPMSPVVFRSWFCDILLPWRRQDTLTRILCPTIKSGRHVLAVLGPGAPPYRLLLLPASPKGNLTPTPIA